MEIELLLRGFWVQDLPDEVTVDKRQLSEIPKFLKVHQCTLEEAISAAKESKRKFEESHSDAGN